MLHTQDTHITQADSYYNALISKKKKTKTKIVQKCCIPSLATKLTMLVTVCLCCYSPSKFEYGQHTNSFV